MIESKTIIENNTTIVDSISSTVLDSTILETNTNDATVKYSSNDLILIDNDEYIVDKLISTKGGEADIYKVSLNSIPFALKIYHKKIQPDVDLIKKLEVINHLHILKSNQIGKLKKDDQEFFYELMPFCSSGNILEFIQKNNIKLSWIDAEKIFLKLASALNYLHGSEIGLIHRDVKPENILLEKDDLNYPLLIDFGIASLKRDSKKETGTAHLDQYTPAYAPPEMTRDHKTHQENDDLDILKTIHQNGDFYSLALTMVSLVLGEHFNKGITNAQLIAHKEDNLLIEKVFLPKLKEIPEKYQQLLSGCLCSIMRMRWDYGKILKWSKGENVPAPFFQDKTSNNIVFDKNEYNLNEFSSFLFSIKNNYDKINILYNYLHSDYFINKIEDSALKMELVSVIKNHNDLGPSIDLFKKIAFCLGTDQTFILEDKTLSSLEDVFNYLLPLSDEQVLNKLFSQKIYHSSFLFFIDKLCKKKGKHTLINFIEESFSQSFNNNPAKSLKYTLLVYISTYMYDSKLVIGPLKGEYLLKALVDNRVKLYFQHQELKEYFKVVLAFYKFFGLSVFLQQYPELTDTVFDSKIFRNKDSSLRMNIKEFFEADLSTYYQKKEIDFDKIKNLLYHEYKDKYISLDKEIYYLEDMSKWSLKIWLEVSKRSSDNNSYLNFAITQNDYKLSKFKVFFKLLLNYSKFLDDNKLHHLFDLIHDEDLLNEDILNKAFKMVIDLDHQKLIDLKIKSKKYSKKELEDNYLNLNKHIFELEKTKNNLLEKIQLLVTQKKKINKIHNFFNFLQIEQFLLKIKNNIIINIAFFNAFYFYLYFFPNNFIFNVSLFSLWLFNITNMIMFYYLFLDFKKSEKNYQLYFNNKEQKFLLSKFSNIKFMNYFSKILWSWSSVTIITVLINSSVQYYFKYFSLAALAFLLFYLLLFYLFNLLSFNFSKKLEKLESNFVLEDKEKVLMDKLNKTNQKIEKTLKEKEELELLMLNA